MEVINLSYCVNCGVEVDATNTQCPLCQTAICNPNQPVDTRSPKPFPEEMEVIGPASKRELAILLSVMFASMAFACGILNFFLNPERMWSLYVIGIAIMLWIWFVPMLLVHKVPMWFWLVCDVLSVGLYVFLISLDLNGLNWFLGLALPIVLLATASVLFLGIALRGGRRSILSAITLIIGTGGVFLLGVELFLDLYFTQTWQPAWSIVALTVCIALIIPLVVVRRVSGLREEARRRFHI